MIAVLVGGVGLVTALYVLTSFAYVRVLGLDGLRASDTAGVDLVRALIGAPSAAIVSALVAAAALTSANATILTVSRTAYSIGRDVHALRGLARWDDRAGVPIAALLALGGAALALVGLGALARDGFATMVEYTAPVFWGFFLLLGVSLFVLRVTRPLAKRPFRVPLYPVTPLVFCATSAWLLHASVVHAGLGSLVGIAVLTLGAVPLWLGARPSYDRTKEATDEATMDRGGDRVRGGVREGSGPARGAEGHRT